MKQLYSHKIDVFPHIVPPKYRDALYEKAERGFYLGEQNNLKVHYEATPTLFNLDSRFLL